MKKFLLSAVLVGSGLVAFAQLVDVESVTKVPLADNVKVAEATISPDGTFFVAADPSGSGIASINVATGQQKVLAKNASYYGVVISDDGENVMFRRITTTSDKLRYTSLYNVNVTTQTEQQLVEPSRHLSGYSFSGKTANAVENGKLKSKNLMGGAATSDIVVSIDYGHLNVTINGETKTLDPQGRSSYLWPQLSPDKTKIVYWVAYEGCFVCNIDGSNPIRLGELRAAKWLGNDMVVGMNDTDNGEQVISSSIIVADLKGTKQTVSNANVIAMYPSTTADGKHIGFVDASGELYVINLK